MKPPLHHKFRFSLEEIDSASQKIIKFSNEKVIIFRGDMGAGKTTLIKSLVAILGSQDDVSSPTFALVNTYETSDSNIYHFDFYRIKHIEEALDIGFEEYLYSGNYVLIEWPERVEALLPDVYLEVRLESISETERMATCIRHH
ncbi:MAG: tRNA (adenosine(37)-N6)-threonylcarbamoyltransferase complex ATPase subunit type 1 TsaE [Flavobacteriaceae bacterium]|nr:tRNA (adenosine(37)-N6)-threonylcarbamoyltransferase complex ATPase subunit type 1 TsaE [Flavobacteriaceae bacterium]